MKLLVAPESKMTCPNLCLGTLLGNLINLHNLNSFFILSSLDGGWYVLSWRTVSFVKFADDSNTFQDGRLDFQLLGGNCESQLGSMFGSPSPKDKPPSETWQNSSATCSLLFTTVCCCSLDDAVWDWFDSTWASDALNVCSKFLNMHLNTAC